MNSTWNKALRSACALAPLALAAVDHGPSPAAAATYYLSSKGSDAGNGTSEETPFASLAKASAVVEAGDEVKFKCGDVFFGTFKPKASGTAAAPIALSSYGKGAKPGLTGFKRITRWTAVVGRPGLYEAVLSPTPTGLLEMVRFDGSLQPKGRLPKAGRGWEQDPTKPGYATDSWFQVKSHTANKQITTADAVPDVTGGEIVQKKYQWILDRGRIDSMKTADGVTTINITEYPVLYNNPYAAFDKNGFFVQNHIRCLTEVGDWCYDAATHKITMFFGAEPPTKHVVEAACVDSVADLTNRCHIRLDGLSLTGANGNLVRLDVPPGTTGQCDHISLNNCDLSFAGVNGIGVATYRHTRFALDAQQGTVTNCTISYINNNGISIEENANWTITGNTVHHVAMWEGLLQSADGQGIGIYLPGENSLVQNNTVSYIGYNGIHFHGSGVQIRSNYVHHFCMVKGDGGGIYTYGGEERKVWAKPRVVDHNIVHDGMGNTEGVYKQEPGNPYAPQAQGIYMDGNTTDVVISNNTVFRVASNGLFLGSNGNITAYGNALADNHTGQLGIDDQKAAQGPFQPTNLNVHDNLCFAFEREQLCLTVGLPRKPQGKTQAEYVLGIGTLANNLYLRPVSEPDSVSTAGYVNCRNALSFAPLKSHRDYGVFNDYPGGGVVFTSWDNQFLSLDKWQQAWGQDKGTKKTGRSVTSVKDLRLEYNPTNAPVVKALPGTFEDAYGKVYTNSITLQPYSSAVLMKK